MMLRNLLAFILLLGTATAASAQCNDIFFSEYLEGSSNEKAIEIYNPTSAPINLSGYIFYRFNNGATVATDTFTTNRVLAPGDVYLIGNPFATANITSTSVSDTLENYTFFNGDDAMAIWKISTNSYIDIIGIIGVDPGASWPVGTGATNEFTLVRKASVQQGQTNWAVGATEWDVYPQNTYTFLGSHTMTPCVAPVNPQVSFGTTTTTVVEGNTSVNVTVNIQPLGSNDTTTVDVVVATGSTATGGADYNYSSVTLSWLPGDSTPQTVTVNVLDDALPEPTETVILELTNLTNNAVAFGGNHTLSITDNDFPYYPIGTINTEDANGVGDSIGVKCWIRGVVYGVNMRPTGLQFTVIDPTGGIGIFNGAAFPGYTVVESDSIHVLGTVNQFNGLLQMDPDSIVLVNTGNTLKQPNSVTALSEATESDLTQFVGAWLVNPAQWTGTGSGFNVDVTDGTNTMQVRIDADVNLYSQPAPVGVFVICGLGGQFDNSNPYTSGYQLLPRYQLDFKKILDLDLGPDQNGCEGDSFTFDAGMGDLYAWSNGANTQTVTLTQAGTYYVTVTNTTYNVSVIDTVVVTLSPGPVAGFSSSTVNGDDYQFTNSSTNATSYAWDFGDGNTSTAQDPVYTYAQNGNYVVTLIATGPCGSDTSDTTITVFIAIDDALSGMLTAYPNPSRGDMSVRFDMEVMPGAVLLVHDVLGRELAQVALPSMAAGSSFRLPSLPRGVHFVELRMDGQVGRMRVVVE